MGNADTVTRQNNQVKTARDLFTSVPPKQNSNSGTGLVSVPLAQRPVDRFQRGMGAGAVEIKGGVSDITGFQKLGAGNTVNNAPIRSGGASGATNALTGDSRLTKDGIVFIGKGNNGEDALFVRKDPGDVLRTLVKLDKEGKASEAVKQIKDVAIATNRGGLPLSVYTINPDGVATDSGAVTQAGSLASSPLLNMISALSGADSSVAQLGFDPLISAIQLLALNTDSADFGTQASQYGFSEQEKNDLVQMIKNNPQLVDGATTTIKALTSLKETYERKVESGKNQHKKLVDSLKGLEGGSTGKTE